MTEATIARCAGALALSMFVVGAIAAMIRPHRNEQLNLLTAARAGITRLENPVIVIDRHEMGGHGSFVQGNLGMSSDAIVAESSCVDHHTYFHIAVMGRTSQPAYLVLLLRSTSSTATDDGTRRASSGCWELINASSRPDRFSSRQPNRPSQPADYNALDDDLPGTL